jgi:hypothetical protein
MVNLFKKTMLSTGQAFCKKPWYLSKETFKCPMLSVKKEFKAKQEKCPKQGLNG